MNKILLERYVSPEMGHIFSKRNRYGKWRLVWIALAEAQAELGFPAVNEKDLEKIRATAEDIDFDRVKEIENEIKHDVMAHLKHWAELCPEVGTNIHLGATSCFVTDNAECMLHKEALHFIIGQVRNLCVYLTNLAEETADIAVLGYTHFQPASPTTIGKRVAMWLQDLHHDCLRLISIHDTMVCRGAKGTTGTQASYYQLADRNATKVQQLDRAIAKKLRFPNAADLTGQTISRKQDVDIADALTQVAISLSKMSNDIRLLSHTGDLREGFANKQVGSSAMPYKRNPMMAERLCALSRLVPQYRNMLTQVAMTQWLERSLDDSATRRVAIPDMFLAINSALNTALRLVPGLVPTCTGTDVNDDEQILLSSEVLLADAVKNGHDRQEVHELLKNYAMQARAEGENYKGSSVTRYWIRALKSDPIFRDYDLAYVLEDLTGLAEEQTLRFVKQMRSSGYSNLEENLTIQQVHAAKLDDNGKNFRL